MSAKSSNGAKLEDGCDPRTDSIVCGFSIVELLAVLAVVMVVAAIAIPYFATSYYSVRLKSEAEDLAGLMQQARFLATKQNKTCQVLYQVNGSAQEAYADLNLDGSWESGEPLVPLPGVALAAGAPNGQNGQPTPYILSGDTGSGRFDNATTLGFTSRGSPATTPIPRLVPHPPRNTSFTT